MRHPSYCHMWKWTRVLGALSLPQGSTAMLVTGAQQHQLQELPPATPSCSAGLQCLKDQEAEGPGRHTGKRPGQNGEWLGEHSHCGLLERSSRERGAVWWQSSSYWLDHRAIGHGLWAHLWERRLKEKPARAQDLPVVWTCSYSAGGLTWAGRGLDVCGAWDAVLSCSCGGGRLQICVEKQRHNSCFILPWHEGMSCTASLPSSLKHLPFLYKEKWLTFLPRKTSKNAEKNSPKSPPGNPARAAETLSITLRENGPQETKWL